METITLADGKYTVTNDRGKLSATRHGEPWRDLTGDNLVYWMLVEIVALQNALMKACGDDAEVAKATLDSQRE